MVALAAAGRAVLVSDSGSGKVYLDGDIDFDGDVDDADYLVLAMIDRSPPPGGSPTRSKT